MQSTTGQTERSPPMLRDCLGTRGWRDTKVIPRQSIVCRVLLLALVWALPLSGDQITVASWNIRIFSTGSRDDTELGLICDRLQQFDLIAIQELRDREVIRRTLAILEARGGAYEALVSDPVGRGQGAVRLPMASGGPTGAWRRCHVVR